MNLRGRNPVILGAIGITVTVAVLIGALEFTKLPFHTSYGYHAQLSQAGQVAPGENVTVAGVKVGTVKGLKLVPSAHGSYVRVDFSLDRKVAMGSNTRLDVKVLSPLGQEYVQLTPGGPGQLPPGSTIPLDHTTVSGTLVATLNQLGATTGGIDTGQLQQALNVTNQDLGSPTPAATQTVIQSLGQLSTTIDQRQAELNDLVNASTTGTATIDAHKTQLVALVGQSNLILQVVEQRQSDLQALLNSTTSLAARLSSLMTSKSSNLTTLLAELNNVSGILAQNKANFAQILPLTAALSKYGANASGNGPFFDAIAPTLFLDDPIMAACGMPGAFKGGEIPAGLAIPPTAGVPLTGTSVSTGSSCVLNNKDEP